MFGHVRMLFRNFQRGTGLNFATRERQNNGLKHDFNKVKYKRNDGPVHVEPDHLPSISVLFLLPTYPPLG